MGTCGCEIHYHQYGNENELNNYAESQTGNSNKISEIISQFSNNTEPKLKNQNKINTIKMNLDKKLPELGNSLNMDEYQKLINKNIIDYISTHKLNYQTYYPSHLATYQSNPIQFPNGNIYHGNWNINSEMEGYGIYLLKEKNVITEGIWIKGNIVYGRIFFPNDDIFEGEMKNSLPHGVGTIYFSNGEIYKGDFNNGEMTGKGTFIFTDKTYYAGEINNGIFNGKGSIKWINGTEYHGNFIDSSLSGKGKMFNNNMGDKYVGNFDKNEFNGSGTYTYQNGDEYQGNFEYGMRKGKGIYRKNNLFEFEGLWDNDLPNGNGMITYNGNKLKGFWRNGILVGNQEVLQGAIEDFNNIDLDIKPYKGNLFPSSLPHLSMGDSEASQFIQGKDLNFS